MIHGEGVQHGPVLCSASRVRLYLHHGCFGFMIYVLDAREKGKATVGDLPIVREYPDVFPKDFPRVPLERKMEFQIELVPGAALIDKAPHRLVPLEMHKLSKKLYELLDEGFI